tara:strand:- start:1598 stop:2389 length:792 start_codon:yes stop_codon:yes gene_type:complete
MKISVLTPSFNSGNYLEKSIQSVLNQSYKDWEHIVVDGGSTDNTVDILKSFKHLKWVSEADKGQSDAMNKAFKMCTGDIIMYLNADDYFYSDAFYTIIKNFENQQNVDMFVGNLHIEKNGKLEPRVKATILWKNLSVLKGRFPLNPVSYAYKRHVQERIGDFPVNEHYTMDYWFLIRAFYLFKIVKIEDFLGCFVFVENNKSSTITGEYEIQAPHALKFTRKFTPMRLPYVYTMLAIHPQNPKSNKLLKAMVKTVVGIKKRLK